MIKLLAIEREVPGSNLGEDKDFEFGHYDVTSEFTQL